MLHSKIKKNVKKVLTNQYLTYFIALFTLFFVTEVINNPENNSILFIKILFKNNCIKLLFFIILGIIGYFNISLALLLLINFFFVINIQSRVETFVSKLPDLIDKNKVLKYKRLMGNQKLESKDKNESNSSKKDYKTTEEKKDTIDDLRMRENYEQNKIKNPIKLNRNESSSNKKKEKTKKQKYLEKKLKKKNIDSKKKKEFLKELKELEEKENELEEQNKNDDTIETELKQRKFEKQQNLEILENETEDDESSSSNSSDTSESESSESSSDSNKEYEDVSLTEAREHVLKKLRNKLKKKYVKGK